MSKPTVELTESEWSIIKVIWENEPYIAPAIQEKLFPSTSWRYSTVRGPRQERHPASRPQ